MMSETVGGRAWGTLWVGLAGFLLVMIAPPLFKSAIDALETRFAPVVTQITVTPNSIRTVSGGVEFSADAVKVRDCDWRKTEVWLRGLGKPDVFLEGRPHRDKPSNNGLGPIHWDRIFVPVGVDDLRNTYAFAYHQCGYSDRLTRSLFWTGSEFDQ